MQNTPVLSNDRQRKAKGFEMDFNTDDQNPLWELAETMTNQDNYPTAIALRKLVQAGYFTLEQVDKTSDWVLLAAPGIGIGRLGMVRRLIRPDWQPPSPQAVKAAERFLSAARFALHFWPVEALEPFMQGVLPPAAEDSSIEKRVAIQTLIQTARRALRYCDAAELAKAMRQSGRIYRDDVPSNSSTQTKIQKSGSKLSTLDPADLLSRGTNVAEESCHFAYPRLQRRRIVQHFQAARNGGEIANKDRWAQANYGISGKTLLTYEREFLHTGAGD
jgi:hypothetical protein